MSMSEWTDYGYGIETTDLEVRDVESIKKLLDLAPVFKKQVESYFKEVEIEPEIEDYEEFDQDYGSGFAYLLKEVIEEAEGVDLCSQSDENGCDYVFYPPCYPWQMTESDYKINTTVLDNLFEKYVSIISDKIPEIEYKSIHSYG